MAANSPNPTTELPEHWRDFWAHVVAAYFVSGGRDMESFVRELKRELYADATFRRDKRYRNGKFVADLIDQIYREQPASAAILSATRGKL